MNENEKNKVDSVHYMGFQSYGYVYTLFEYEIVFDKFPQRNQDSMTIM